MNDQAGDIGRTMQPQSLCRSPSHDKVGRLLLAIGVLSVAVGLACTLPITLLPSSETEVFERDLAEITAGQGGSVELSDGAAFDLPTEVLLADAIVSLERVPSDQLTGGEFDLGVPVGARYEVSLGGGSLAGTGTLRIPFDPHSLPANSGPEQVFLAVYEAPVGEWMFAGGEVDTNRSMLTVLIDHASWWNPFTWNWDAWIAFLNRALRGSIVEFIQALALLTDDCPQEGEYANIDSRRANNVVQGCVETDLPDRPQLRIVNPKSFFFEVKPVSGGDNYFSPTLLSPGESIRFEANTADPSPFVVAAEINQRSGRYLVVHMLITMLPGWNQLGIQGAQVACITERLGDVSHLVSAVEALIVDHDGLAAAEQIGRFYRDADAARRFISASDDCFYGPAKTWSVEGLRQVGGAVSTILSATDYVANYMAGNQYSEIVFLWSAKDGSESLLGAWEGLVSGGVDGEPYERYEYLEFTAQCPLTEICLMYRALPEPGPYPLVASEGGQYCFGDGYNYYCFLLSEDGNALMFDGHGPLRTGTGSLSRPNARREVGPDAVWEVPSNKYVSLQNCLIGTSSQAECMASVMQESGASPEAIDLTLEYGAEWILVSLEEKGKVDVGVVFYPIRANDNWQWVMLNGSPTLVSAEETWDLDITIDPNYPSLAGGQGNLLLWGSDNQLEATQELREGGQRFVFSYPLYKGCHACGIGGYVLAGFDFGPQGLYLGKSLLALGSSKPAAPLP